jgi:hypothetical protein
MRKSLSAGAVITGGGAHAEKYISISFANLLQAWIARIGYPNEHLSAGNDEIKSPMYLQLPL